MTEFTKQEARDVIEDALRGMTNASNRGHASGLIGAFYMVGILSDEEHAEYMGRIPAEEGGDGH